MADKQSEAGVWEIVANINTVTNWLVRSVNGTSRNTDAYLFAKYADLLCGLAEYLREISAPEEKKSAGDLSYTLQGAGPVMGAVNG